MKNKPTTKAKTILAKIKELEQKICKLDFERRTLKDEYNKLVNNGTHPWRTVTHYKSQ